MDDNYDKNIFKNYLSEEEINFLIRTQEGIEVTKEERLKAICTHYDSEGHNMLDIVPQTNKVKCKICGKEFTFKDNYSDDEVIEATQKVIDIVQNSKVLYCDLSDKALKEFYIILALLERVPKVYKNATENFVKHETESNTWKIGQSFAMNEHNALCPIHNIFCPTHNSMIEK